MEHRPNRRTDSHTARIPMTFDVMLINSLDVIVRNQGKPVS